METHVYTGAAQRTPAVFVVDDDGPVRESTCALLEAHGMAVSAYASPTDFLGQAAVQQGDCLLLDNHMPGMTGLELVDVLRTRNIAIPIIMFTGGSDPVMKERARRAGVLMVLDKPVNEDYLLQAIAIAQNAAKDLY